jgi:4'-phosphopantetheinyl transferase
VPSSAQPVPAAPELWLLRVSGLWGGGPVGDPPPGAASGLAVGELDADERHRADAFVHAVDRVRYLAAHIALRRLLAAVTGTAARDLVLVREPCPCCGAPHGRPALADASGAGSGASYGRGPLHFSLSHGGDLVLIGIADVPIGVDVEALPEERALDDLASVLHPGEQAELAALPAEQRVAAFARLWTRKEAYLKGLGTGLGRDPGADYLGTTGRAPTPPGWTVADLDLTAPPPGIDADAGHAAAFAVRGGPAATATPAAARPRWLAPDFVREQVSIG